MTIRQILGCTVLLAKCGLNAFGSVETNSSAGIDSASLVSLNGDGINIGQVELLRPGKPGFDSGTNSNFGTQPVVVYLLDDRINPTANAQDEIYALEDPDDPGSDLIAHATWVAGVMISKDGLAPGVAKEGNLYSSHGSYFTNPVIDRPDSLSLTSQFIATRADDEVRAINLSFGIPFEVNEIANGNSKFTEFIDWSAAQHNVLYVVAGSSTILPASAQPTDNYNGMTIGASVKNGGVYRQVASLNDFDFDATGSRTSISLIAPGESVEIADVGGPIPPTVTSGTSFAAPHVTGTVALLQQHAERKILSPGSPRWTDNARRHEVMKAVLMNSADKLMDTGDGRRLGMTRTVLDENGADWLTSEAYTGVTSDTKPLDDQMGAGHLNAKRAYQQFNPGEFDAGGGAVPAVGWDYGMTDGFEDIQEYVLSQQIPANQFVSITLAWDREMLFDIDNGDAGVFDEGDEFINNTAPIDLNLYLLPAGSTDIGDAVARSNANDTSVEHIFYQNQTDGQYEIWVEQAGGSVFTTQNYALAWMMAKPAEPVFGDYSGNGTVGPEDYTLWSSNFGSTSQLAADGNGNAIIDAADYTVWRDSLGQMTGVGSLASVPEPTSSMLWTSGLLVVFARRRRRA